jgi:hypothetical protein
MRFLTLYTPSTPMSGPPSPAMMEKMSKLMETETRAGHLIATGALKKREAGGLTVTRKNDKFDVVVGPDTLWMRANGYAILEAKSRNDVIEQVRHFLTVAGDGVSEVIEIADMPPQ